MPSTELIPAAVQRRVAIFRNGEIQTFVPGSEHFLSAATPAWAGFPLEEGAGTLEPTKRAMAIKTVLVVGGKQHGEVRWFFRGSSHHERMSAGAIFLLRAGVEIVEVSRTQAYNRTGLLLDTDRLTKLYPMTGVGESQGLVPTVFSQNRQVADIVRLMRAEIKAGCPNGPLYAESLSIALVGLLRAKYSATCPPIVDHRSLSPKETERILDYISEHLSDNLSVTRLADLVQLSPDHFSRVFKTTFGTGPYQFVLLQRVEKAKIIMRNPERDLVDIAVTLGFSSHTHFSRIFRKLTGLSPSKYRRLC
ncbi:MULTISPECIES: helix-turn-helix transcriptional regulator [Methylopilaceae]|nr:AraC family transcriptional regulator [Hansschlegelia zhihuaiae]